MAQSEGFVAVRHYLDTLTKVALLKTNRFAMKVLTFQGIAYYKELHIINAERERTLTNYLPLNGVRSFPPKAFSGGVS